MFVIESRLPFLYMSTIEIRVNVTFSQYKIICLVRLASDVPNSYGWADDQRLIDQIRQKMSFVSLIFLLPQKIHLMAEPSNAKSSHYTEKD